MAIIRFFWWTAMGFALLMVAVAVTPVLLFLLPLYLIGLIAVIIV
jgi:hypothetical protein